MPLLDRRGARLQDPIERRRNCGQIHQLFPGCRSDRLRTFNPEQHDESVDHGLPVE